MHGPPASANTLQLHGRNRYRVRSIGNQSSGYCSKSSVVLIEQTAEIVGKYHVTAVHVENFKYAQVYWAIHLF